MTGVTVSLTADEALVLLDWLATENEIEKVAVEPSVRQTLWSLEAVLESVVGAVVAGDYAQQVAQARARLTAAALPDSDDPSVQEVLD